MVIIDDFLEQKDFDELQFHVMSGKKFKGGEFSWFYRTVIDYKDDEDKYQFIHSFYEKSAPMSQFIEILTPIINSIDAISLFRIKANLLTRTPDIIKNQFHIDIGMSEEKLKQLMTSIFYVNTNNGYTEFEDGTKVESIANRMVFFPSNVKHRGTSCTDERVRVVINFNYFSKHFCE